MTASPREISRHRARVALCPACWPRVQCVAAGRTQTVLDNLEDTRQRGDDDGGRAAW